MKRYNLIFVLLLCIFAAGSCGNQAEVGKVLPDWSEGCLDIHAINTGRGESSLLIFPDGTTMLVDAAGANISYDNRIPPPPRKPNEQADPAQTIINYVSHFTAPVGGSLNYIMASHWHGDHVGGQLDTTKMATHTDGGFVLWGMAKVGAGIAFDKLIDRGFYYPQNIIERSPMVSNYAKFAEWAAGEYSAERELFRVGATDQIVLKKNPTEYGDFHVRNVVGSGVVWTGEGHGTRSTLPASEELVGISINDNILSLGFHVQYGDFDYFSAGDLQYSGSDKHPWFDIEAPVAEAVPQVEVLKANHHGTKNCNSAAYLNALKPDAILVHVWRDVQPNPKTVARMFDVNPDCRIFTTNMSDKNKERLGAETVSRIKSTNGHIVVRVAPKGKKYHIYVLDDNNEDYVVREIFGPYRCK